MTAAREPDPGAARRAAGHREGAAWLLADMTFITVMLAVVKQAGTTFPAVQLVFLRALVGLVLVLPLVWHYRRLVFDTRRLGGHLVRVACNAVALSCNFAAVAALPLALVTTIGFTRPLVVLGLAALLLGERVSRLRWAASGVCFAGVLVIARPDGLAWDLGILAAFGSVLFGSLAVIQTRRLAGEHTVLLMLSYTLGLTLLMAVPAALVWVPPTTADLAPLLVIGLLAQLGQFCFLRAYQVAEARVLAPLSYLAILFSAAADYLFFGLVPGLPLALGAAVIVAALTVERFDRRA